MSPAYVDFKPTLKQQREDRRQKLRMLLYISPCVVVAIFFYFWR